MNPKDRKEEMEEKEPQIEQEGEIELTSEPQDAPEATPEDDSEKESEDLQQKYLRLAADFENYKKRISKEKADVLAYGNEEIIKALLNILDNFERALEHSESEESTALFEGVQLVHKQFVSCLEKFDVTKVDAEKGTQFDPRFHQAIERVESEELSSGLILSQMLPGYMLKDRLLRPALVVVSKGIDKKDTNGGVAGFTSADNS